MMQNEHDAEDALQTAFVDIFSKLDSFKYQSTLGAWIKRIVINKCINQLKKKRIHFEEITDHVQNGLFQSVEESNGNNYSVSGIKNALVKLPDGYRLVFSLYAMEGYDHEEIGEILGITVSTSKSQYSRAKKKIKQLLNETELEKTNL